MAVNDRQEESYVATVTNNEDPETRGRIKVACTALLGDEQRELPGWIDSALQWGWFTIPDVGQQVTIYIVTGSSTDTRKGQTGIMSPKIYWRGDTYFTDDDAENANPVGTEFTEKNYGKRRGFKTPGGHVLLFDDTDGDSQVRMSWAGKVNGEEKSAFWAIDNEGSFMVQDSGGSLFYMNGKDGESSIINKHGHRIAITKGGISLVDGNGNSMVMDDNGISFISKKSITFGGSNHIFSNGIQFEALGIPPLTTVMCNLGALAASFNRSSPGGLALQLATAGNLAAPGAPTWATQQTLLNQAVE